MMRHPREGAERLRGRWDRHWDKRALMTAGRPAHALYGVTEDWAECLHVTLGVPWPCEAAASFGYLWDRIVAGLTERGARVGIASYARWNDGDRAFGEAIWCLVAHLRPETVVETGVAHGLTSRVILEGLDRNGSGHLWSIDLPAVDSALHSEIGMAVPKNLRPRWSYVQGTARRRLPGLLGELRKIDLFIHDSLHTGPNQRFELESAWAALRPGGVAVVDDVDHSQAFPIFVDEVRPRAWLTARHITGPGMLDPDGLWGLAVKGTQAPGPASQTTSPHSGRLVARQHRTARAASMKAIEANPHYMLLRTLMSESTVRERRHEQIELSVVREIAFIIRGLALTDGRLLQIQAWQGPEVLLFRDQLVRPARPVLYDQAERHLPDVRAAADLEEVDLDSARLPAPDNHFDLAVWNRDLVTLKNVMPALRQVRRVIRPDGFLVLALPNLAAAHNRLLLLAGRQPSTLHINNGDHLRGFAAPTMTRILRHDLEFDVLQAIGVGIAPVTSSPLPRPLRGLSHSVIWVLQNPATAHGPAPDQRRLHRARRVSG
jgi:SAM-dependent methyltransferase/predicted O-methyltransferase YrrM